MAKKKSKKTAPPELLYVHDDDRKNEFCSFSHQEINENPGYVLQVINERRNQKEQESEIEVYVYKYVGKARVSRTVTTTFTSGPPNENTQGTN